MVAVKTKFTLNNRSMKSIQTKMIKFNNNNKILANKELKTTANIMIILFKAK